MPTRVYSNFIRGLQNELSNWLTAADSILSTFRICAIDPRMGRTIQHQNEIAKKYGLQHENLPTFENIAPPSCLEYIKSKGKPPNFNSLSHLVAEAQLTAKFIIQTFTGMRDDEAASLPYHCLEVSVVNGRTHYIVKGRTTKLNNGLVKSAQWVTNYDGYQAIQAAIAIADVIYGVYGVTPVQTRNRLTSYPLFVSVGYMNPASEKKTPEGDFFVPGGLKLRHQSTLHESLFSIIEDADIRELEHIDPHRAWRSEEKFKVGRRWKFTSHQLRRSLALYAQRSGLVSLPSLRRQLQHITEEMSRYYARGSAFAMDFIGKSKDHFGFEWQAAQPESAGLSYLLNVLLAEDTLFGGHANWVEHRLKGPDGFILVDRDDTMQRFKKGTMAYRETFIGGCTNTHECDKVAIRWIDAECLRDNCKNLVCNLSKLERVISAQQRMIAGLDPESIDYRTEKADLEVLTEARDQAIQQRQKGAM